MIVLFCYKVVYISVDQFVAKTNKQEGLKDKLLWSKYLKIFGAFGDCHRGGGFEELDGL